MKRVLTVALGAFLLTLSISAQAELRLPALFSDHMVLQHGAVAPVWGWADPGASVTVSIAGQEISVTAGSDGKWQADLAPLAAGGGPHALRVSDGDSTHTFSDVLVGEVWIASGQSNMQMTVKSSANAEEEIANANHPSIRLFYVPREVAETPQTDVDAEWTECTSETVAGFSAVAYYFGRELHETLDIPVGIIHTSWGGTPAESWVSLPTLLGNPTLHPIIERWWKTLGNYPAAFAKYEESLSAYDEAKKAAGGDASDLPPRPRAPTGPKHPHRPASLYNGMIAPLVPYAFTGAIWYQGESNAGRAYQYRELFPVMIEDWRRAWGKLNFPFYFVQLANYYERTDDANEPSAWAELREAQNMTLDLPNTGQAVIIDIGDAGNIHPTNKQDVGKRLALAALHQTYGRDVAYSGPTYESMTVEGKKVVVKFGHEYDGLVTRDGEELVGFAVAGADRVFHWAKGAIAEDGTVVISSGEVGEPVAVRYGWANNPDCNLYNSAGLPASPFRTDIWPGVTVDNH